MKIELDITKMFNDDRMCDMFHTDPYIRQLYDLIMSNIATTNEEIFISVFHSLSTSNKLLTKELQERISNQNIQIIKVRD